MQNPEFVKAAFAAIAPKYVTTNHVLSLGIDLLWRERVTERIAEWNPRHLLDIATGTGDLALAIQRACPDIRVTGSDFCAPMLDIARKRGLRDLHVADALDLPFANESYDCVTVAFGLRNMASWLDALAEMHRVLVPGGHVAILDFSLPGGILKGPYRWYLHNVLPRVAGWITGHPEAYDYLGESIEVFPSGEKLCALMNEAGFCEAYCEPLSGGIASLYTAMKPSRREA